MRLVKFAWLASLAKVAIMKVWARLTTMVVIARSAWLRRWQGWPDCRGWRDNLARR